MESPNQREFTFRQTEELTSGFKYFDFDTKGVFKNITDEDVFEGELTFGDSFKVAKSLEDTQGE